MSDTGVETESEMKMTGVILAAGTSSRMGSVNKLTLIYHGRTIIEEVLRQMIESKVDDILVITGHEHKLIEKLLDQHRSDRIDCIYNPDYLSGRGSSIKCAIEGIKDRADAALFMVADKPQVKSSLINKAIDLFMEKRPHLLYIETPAGRGHPIIFSKELFHELSQLEGDLVGDELVSRYKDMTIRLQDEIIQIDIDNEDDYRALMENASRQ